MDFDQTWYIQSLRESGTLLIFKVKGQGRRVKFLGEGICLLLALTFDIMQDIWRRPVNESFVEIQSWYLICGNGRLAKKLVR
jgi:hypothetical protein